MSGKWEPTFRLELRNKSVESISAFQRKPEMLKGGISKLQSWGKLPFAILTALACSILPLQTVEAQDQRIGIAFAYAPEQGFGVCTGTDPQTAFECAQKKCTESGASVQDCLPVSWCFPSGWSVAANILHPLGNHWTEFRCGWHSRKEALAAGALLCETAERNMAQDCAVAVLWDEAGKEILIDEGQ